MKGKQNPRYSDTPSPRARGSGARPCGAHTCARPREKVCPARARAPRAPSRQGWERARAAAAVEERSRRPRAEGSVRERARRRPAGVGAGA